MKVLFAVLKPLSFAPALAIMYMIYFFSAQPGEVSSVLSYEISYEIVETKDQILNTQLSYDQLSQQANGIHYYVRKAAHVTEYLLLAIAVSFPLYVYGARGIWLIFLSGLICVSFAGLDEYHQSYVESRGPSPKDVAIDSIGVFLGIGLVQAFCWSVLHKPKR